MPTSASPESAKVLGWVLTPEGAALYESLLQDPHQLIEPGDPAVQELIDARFAHADWTDPTRLLLLPPELVITRVVAGRARRWLDSAPDFDIAERVLGAYQRATREQPPSPEGLDSSAARQQAAAMLVASARDELCLMQPYPSWMPDQIRDDAQASASPDQATLAIGVTHRYLYDERILSDSQFRKLALEEVDLGVHARVAARLPTWMAIADRSSALYLPNPDLTDGAGTTEPGLVALLHMAFEAAWASARPLDATSSNENLTGQHREVLMLIIAGHPIGTIARLMKLDVKTVRRRTADLCDHFHVTDRTALLATALVGPTAAR